MADKENQPEKPETPAEAMRRMVAKLRQPSAAKPPTPPKGYRGPMAAPEVDPFLDLTPIEPAATNSDPYRMDREIPQPAVASGAVNDKLQKEIAALIQARKKKETPAEVKPPETPPEWLAPDQASIPPQVAAATSEPMAEPKAEPKLEPKLETGPQPVVAPIAEAASAPQTMEIIPPEDELPNFEHEPLRSPDISSFENVLSEVNFQQPAPTPQPEIPAAPLEAPAPLAVDPEDVAAPAPQTLQEVTSSPEDAAILAGLMEELDKPGQFGNPAAAIAEPMPAPVTAQPMAAVEPAPVPLPQSDSADLDAEIAAAFAAEAAASTGPAAPEVPVTVAAVAVPAAPVAAAPAAAPVVPPEPAAAVAAEPVASAPEAVPASATPAAAPPAAAPPQRAVPPRPPASRATSPAPVEKKPSKNLVLAKIKANLAALFMPLVRLAGVLGDVVLGLLGIIDLPFSRIPLATKQILAWVGFTLMASGAAMLVLAKLNI